MRKIRVTVWYEYTQESGYLSDNVVQPGISHEDYENFLTYVREARDKILSVYPDGLMAPIINALKSCEDIEVTYVTMYDPCFGLPDDLLERTDVLVWWAHICHDKLPDDIAWKIVYRVQKGMGFVALHSAHMSKPFRWLMGTSGTLRWRDGDFCRVWNVEPTHPIARGVPDNIELPVEEMYGETFDIPKPDDIVFMSWFRGGELLRSGCTWTRGYGKIFYFQPGHETNSSYNNPEIIKIICNAVRWAAPDLWRDQLSCEKIINPPESL